MQRVKLLQKTFLVFGLAFAISGVQAAGVWSEPTTITQTGAWGSWFGVVVADTRAASGCAGNGTKAIDISTSSPTSKAQVALLIAAQAAGKRVQLYYEYCTAGTSVITNVQVLQ